MLAPTWCDYAALGLTEIRQYGASSVQVARRLHELYHRLLEVVDGPDRARVELERRLLDRALVTFFPDEEERGVASGGDRLGLGGR